MGCIVKFSESLIQFEFNSHGNRQKMLIDMLLRYGEFDMNSLAATIGISVAKLHDIYDGKYFLDGEESHDLAQVFLIFFGQQFFKKFTLVRNFF